MKFAPNNFFVIIIKIETYWNVNMAFAKCDYIDKNIKMETYWNVNKVKKI